MDINTILEQLDLLKGIYQRGHVSVLVGAGFSRNACEAYPSWGKLLYDMAAELHQNELGRAYMEHIRSCPNTSLSRAAFLKREIPNVIANAGYLGLVSQYIRKKGFREAIEYYIEERIPYIDVASGAFKFAGKNASKSIPVDKDKFSAHIQLLKGKWERVYTTNYDTLLEFAARMSNIDYTVVTRAHQLSISSDATPTIIKLHGDLQDPSMPRRFEFDSNLHQQYIISEEDYATYPSKHEAFTQLMRISLLQGVFCLVGFSGDDPNFVNWIRWVRDILVRNTENGLPQYKIFLFDISRDMPPSDKQMYFDNHNILYVPLLNSDVKRYIGSTSKEPRDILVDFFEFLYQQDETSTTTYSSMWWKLEKREREPAPGQDPLIGIDENTASKIITAKARNRIVRPDKNRIDILRILNRQSSMTTTEAILGTIALCESGLPMSYFDGLGEKMLSALTDSPYSERCRQLKDRSDTLCSFDLEFPHVSSFSYENLLRALFSLNYKLAKQIVDTWQPCGADIMKKAFWLSYFNDDAERMLADYIKNEPNRKEQYHATRLLVLFDRTFPPRYSTVKYSNYHIVDYWQIMDSMFHDISDVDKKVTRYGDGTHERVFHIGGAGDDKYEKSMALLGFLLETPLTVSYKDFIKICDSSDWYAVFRNIFERHPFAALFYSLQCTDDKVKTRIGQDYAYSDAISSSCLPLMLEHLLKAYLSPHTPTCLKRSVLIIAQEMFVSVRPVLWEQLFMSVWENHVIPYIKGDQPHPREALTDFAKKGLFSVKSTSCRRKIIMDCLSVQHYNRDFVISCFYYLRPQRKDVGGSSELRQVVSKFVAGISHPLELTIAGNMYKLLSPEDLKNLTRQTRKMLGGKDVEDIVYRSASYFIKRGSQEERLFARSLCRNPRLWANGILPNGGYSSATEHLSLSNYSPNVHLDAGAVRTIYKKLKTSLMAVSESRVFTDGYYHFTHHDELLAEMNVFLNRHRPLLSKERDYERVYHTVIDLYNRAKGYDCIEDGLLSIYNDNIVGALDYIYMNRHTIGHRQMVSLVQIIANRVLLMHGDGINACLAFLEFCLCEKIITPSDESVYEILGYILEKTTLKTIQENGLNVVNACNNLCGLARIMIRNNHRSVGIQKWLSFSKNNRFYSN